MTIAAVITQSQNPVRIHKELRQSVRQKQVNVWACAHFARAKLSVIGTAGPRPTGFDSAVTKQHTLMAPLLLRNYNRLKADLISNAGWLDLMLVSQTVASQSWLVSVAADVVPVKFPGRTRFYSLSQLHGFRARGTNSDNKTLRRNLWAAVRPRR